jgi:hypothetical protein
MAGINSSFDVDDFSDTMTFEFSNPVEGVGGFLNYAPGYAPATTIAVYNSSDTLIESYNLTFTTAGGSDEGAFFGFLENTPDIKYFTLTDGYIGLADLTVTPEPDSLLLLGMGLAGLGGLVRRRSFGPQ